MLRRHANNIIEQINAKVDESQTLADTMTQIRDSRGLYFPNRDEHNVLIKLTQCGIALNKLFASSANAIMFREGTDIHNPVLTPARGLPKELGSSLSFGTALLHSCNLAAKDYLNTLKANRYPLALSKKLIEIRQITKHFYLASVTMHRLVSKTMPEDRIMIAHITTISRAMRQYYRQTRQETRPYFDQLKARGFHAARL